ALRGEVLPDLADVVVHPPDARVVLALVAEVRLAERRHRGWAEASAAHRTQVEEAAESGAEEVAVDDTRSAQGRVRDARRIPDEERRVGERARAAGNGDEHGIGELEEVADAGERERVVGLPPLRAAQWLARATTATTAAAWELPEPPRPEARQSVEADLSSG